MVQCEEIDNYGDEDIDGYEAQECIANFHLFVRGQACETAIEQEDGCFDRTDSWVEQRLANQR